MKISDIKVVLVSPPNAMGNSKMVEPLGLMYIEGALKALGVEVEMVDLSFDKDIPSADAYGFSACTANFSYVINLAQKLSPAYTIIGGPHCSSLPEEAKKYFNAVVVGPGEMIIEKILNDFLDGKGGIYRGINKNIDLIPIPSRTILKRLMYKPFSGVSRSATMITSRGCPYKCAFCSSRVIWGRETQFRSVENIVKEVMYLKDIFEIDCIKFVDDMFTLDMIRFKQVAKALHNLSIKWFCQTRVDAVKDEVLDLIVEAGGTMIDLGVESVDDLVLKIINKKQTISVVKDAITRIKKKNLKVKTYLIHGLPFEPEDIVQKTIDFIEETEPDLVSVFTLVPYPGTDIWNNPTKYGVKKFSSNFDRYQYSVGNNEDEQLWYPSVEYHNRSVEKIRKERNILKNFAMSWNEEHSIKN